ncbi:hypothetical protein BDW71DRAFT_171825 [Aspergillus fruticulosus]
MDSYGLPAHDTRRRRSALACNTCRGRRTKCDSKRPKCSFCVERGKDCFYQEPQDLSPSPLKAELSRIWEQLDHITAIVQGRNPSSSPPSNEQQNHVPLTVPDAPRGFPFMIVQSEAFLTLLGLDNYLPMHLEHMERGRQIITAKPSRESIVMVDLPDASILLHAFREQIYIWYPILHAGFANEFLEPVTSCFPFSVSSCLTLLVLAIGCVVKCESIVDALRTGPEATYIQAAFTMLPCVLADSSPRSAQCLLLFSIYHLCYAQPCQAHDFVVMASHKLQNYMLKCVGRVLGRVSRTGHDVLTSASRSELDTGNDTTIIGNCFWAALLIESELRVQLDFVDSGIWNMTLFAPAPTASSIWTWRELTPSLDSSGSFTSNESETHSRSDYLSYFVAEIAMRNMLQRCTWATSTLAQGRHVYAPIVAAELERQLDEWLQLLPESLSFRGRGSTCIGSHPLRNSDSAQVEFLRAQYYAFKASIYWPAVYEALPRGETDGNLIRHCAKFFSSYAEFVPSAAAALAVCKPNLWTLCASVFTISMATLLALTEPCLVEVAPQGVYRGLEVAVNVFDGVAEASPSLAEMGAILRDRVRLYNSS